MVLEENTMGYFGWESVFANMVFNCSIDDCKFLDRDAKLVVNRYLFNSDCRRDKSPGDQWKPIGVHYC